MKNDNFGKIKFQYIVPRPPKPEKKFVLDRDGNIIGCWERMYMTLEEIKKRYPNEVTPYE